MFDLVLEGSSSIEEERVAAFPKNTRMHESPLTGLSFSAQDRQQDEQIPASFSFEQEIPSVTLTSVETISFETFHWHSQSQTFHGTLVQKPANDQESISSIDWDVVLQFSSDLRFISKGIIIKKLHYKDNATPYPLDGDWTVQWESGASDVIHVRNNTFEYGGYRYELDLSNPDRAKFVWPFEPYITQTAVEGMNLSQPPAVRSRVVWNTSENERIVWTRATMGNEQVHRLGPLRHLYTRVNADAISRTRPSYHGDTLWNNVFCQAFKVGLASYHFLSSLEQGAYISYQHPYCSRWPPLDNGMPVPSQIYFHDASFDESERVFRGTIEWFQDYNTTWQGCSKWIYEMKFDSEYTCILSGGVKSILLHANNEEQDMSTFGVDLVYINAAIVEKFEALVASESLDEQATPAERYLQYVRVSESIRTRIRDEGASVRTVAAVGHVLAGAQGGEPIDYNL